MPLFIYIYYLYFIIYFYIYILSTACYDERPEQRSEKIDGKIRMNYNACFPFITYKQLICFEKRTCGQNMNINICL